jgi:hypothetical protein
LEIHQEKEENAQIKSAKQKDLEKPIKNVKAKKHAKLRSKIIHK